MSKNTELSKIVKQSKLTKTEIASKSGISRVALSNLENGAIPLLTTARSLSKVLKSKIDKLFPIVENEDG